MGSKTAVRVGKHSLELSNLEKVLYPDEGIIKARIIEYYVKVAPAMLRHIKGRPLSLVRFPDGIYGEAFFQKNRPDWVPEWIPHVRLENIDYMLAAEEAALVFLANLAAIEFHQMQIRPEISPYADYMVFDLDPPQGFDFSRLVSIAFELRESLEANGYHPFLKTTGNKGLHLVVPIQPAISYDHIFEEAKRLAESFSVKNSETTLHIKKEHRKGRVLIDIYRNRPGQTIVGAYSLRGKPGAPVSFPLSWEELESVPMPGDFNIDTVPDLLQQRGDIWEAMYAYSSPLGGSRAGATGRTKKKRIENVTNADTADLLNRYEKKRSFAKTPEPPAVISAGTANLYVVHRHHASRLHYDLRLEQDGVLKSWAVPKGLPPVPGIKRLAVQVEEHPIKYVDFEGVIPKGQYGAGHMWIFSRGKYEITKRKKDGFYFRLNSEELTAEYRMIHTRDHEWLMERVDPIAFPSSLEPMLSISMDTPPSGNYLYEVKWDGIRAILYLQEGGLQILSRSGRDITALFPELTADSFRATAGIFDGEIVCLDEKGKPVFTDVIRRIQQSPSAAEKMSRRHPAVCYLFDCLYLDGRSLQKDPLTRRRDWLLDSIREGTSFRFSESVEDGAALFEAARTAGLEGIMAKEKTGVYIPGKRSSQWVKVKSRHTADCVIIGYAAGRSARRDSIGALQLAVPSGSGLRYSGRVGSGFDTRMLEQIRAQLEKKRMKSPPEGITIPREEMPDTVWVEPVTWCEIEFASITEGGLFREPVFLRVRPDLA